MTQSKTDAQGRFQIADAPADEVIFEMSKKGYLAVWDYPLTASDQEHVITLKPTLSVRGKVLDAETNQPISKFSYIPGFPMGYSKETHWDRLHTRAHVNGQYDEVFSFPRDSYFVRIEAEGYQPAISSRFTGNEGEVSYDFKLKRGSWLTGIVVDANGEPVSGTQLAIHKPRRPAYVANNIMQQLHSVPATKTGGDGRFSLSPQEEDFTLAVLHDSGFAQVRKESFSSSVPIKLLGWGRIEGALRIGSKPGSQQVIRVEPDDNRHPESGNVWVAYSTKTDSSGHFLFDRVVPGSYRIGREIVLWEKPGVSSSSTITHLKTVTIKTGESAQVTIGGTGRPIVGKIEPPANSTQAVDWSRGVYGLEEAAAESAKDPADTTRRSRYAFKVQADGTFRIEDVPAGQYVLKISIYGSADELWPGGRKIQEIQRDVIVPSMPGGRSDEPLDLGSLGLKQLNPDGSPASQPRGAKSGGSTSRPATPQMSTRPFAIYPLASGQSVKDAEKLPVSDLILADQPLLTDEDLNCYDWNTHTMWVQPEALSRMPKSHVIPFVLVANGKRCYAGAFVTWASSYMPHLPTVTLGFSLETSPNRPNRFASRRNDLKISRGFVDNNAPDPRNSDAIREALGRVRKLCNQTSDSQPADQSSTQADKFQATETNTSRVEKESSGRIIHFPADKSVGSIMTYPRTAGKPQSFMHWKYLAPAKGEVAIPPNVQVKLSIARIERIKGSAGFTTAVEDVKDFSFLTKLRPEDLDVLDLNSSQVKDHDLVHVRNLTGLREIHLSGTSITDASLIQLEGLRSLENLYLDRTDFTDAALEHIGKLTWLKQLSLSGCTRISGLDGSIWRD